MLLVQGCNDNFAARGCRVVVRIAGGGATFLGIVRGDKRSAEGVADGWVWKLYEAIDIMVSLEKVQGSDAERAE